VQEVQPFLRNFVKKWDNKFSLHLEQDNTQLKNLMAKKEPANAIPRDLLTKRSPTLVKK